MIRFAVLNYPLPLDTCLQGKSTFSGINSKKQNCLSILATLSGYLLFSILSVLKQLYKFQKNRKGTGKTERIRSLPSAFAVLLRDKASFPRADLICSLINFILLLDVQHQ